MPTLGEVYNPLIEAALANDPKGHELLAQLGQRLFELHPDRASSVEEATEQAKANLDYYCQYFNDGAAKVKAFYGLGASFRSLGGKTVIK